MAITAWTKDDFLKVLKTFPPGEERQTSEIAELVYSPVLHKRGSSISTAKRILTEMSEEKNNKIVCIKKKGTTGSKTGYILFWKLKE